MTYKHVIVTNEISMCDHLHAALTTWANSHDADVDTTVAMATRIGMVYLIADELEMRRPPLSQACEREVLVKHLHHLEHWLARKQPTPNGA